MDDEVIEVRTYFVFLLLNFERYDNVLGNKILVLVPVNFLTR
jgi:hypothetical protein